MSKKYIWPDVISENPHTTINFPDTYNFLRFLILMHTEFFPKMKNGNNYHGRINFPLMKNTEF